MLLTVKPCCSLNWPPAVLTPSQTTFKKNCFESSMNVPQMLQFPTPTTLSAVIKHPKNNSLITYVPHNSTSSDPNLIGQHTEKHAFSSIINANGYFENVQPHLRTEICSC